MRCFLYLCVFLCFNQVVYSQNENNNTDTFVFEYDTVQTKPQYPGGTNEFIKFVMKNFQTEELEGLSGIIKVSMIIDIDGSIKDIKILQDIGGSSAAEAKRVIGKLMKWTPAKNNGVAVKVKYEFPITIQ